MPLPLVSISMAVSNSSLYDLVLSNNKALIILVSNSPMVTPDIIRHLCSGCKLTFDYVHISPRPHSNYTQADYSTPIAPDWSGILSENLALSAVHDMISTETEARLLKVV